MKIGVLLGQLTQLGGVGIAALEEVKNFNKLGHDSELIILKEKKKFRQDGFTSGIPVRWLSKEYPGIFKINFKIPFFSFFSLFHLISPYAALTAIKPGQYDFIICHESYNCFTALKLSQKIKIPYILFMWDPISYILPRVYSRGALRFAFPVLKSLAKYFDKKFTRSSLKTVTCSNVHVNLLSAISKCRDRIATVYPGCYPLDKIPEKRKDYILALTKWDIGKNPLFLLEVLRNLKNKTAKLIMAGNWVQQHTYHEVMKKAKEYNLMDRIEITGRADKETKARLFREARVLVHPIFEAFGMMCLEAAGFGCPFIIPKNSGVTELFEDNVHGFFPDEGDVGGFARYIDMLLDNEGLARDMGCKAWEVAKNNTWLDHTKKLLDTIQ